jgi:3-keto-disaccharide hydrolase
MAKLAATHRSGKGTVVVYRPGNFMGSAPSHAVQIDGKSLVNINNGRVFVGAISPGDHVFQIANQDSGTEVPLKPGANPASGPGKILFQDDFANPNSGWKNADVGSAQFSYSNGVRRIVVKQERINTHDLLPNQKFGDVSIEADVTFATSGTDGAFGILCRATADQRLRSGYQFLIATDGSAGILKTTGPNAGQSPTLNGTNHSSAVHPGAASNHLRADCAGGHLTLYVNGQKVASAQDGEFKSGQVGFAISSPPNSKGFEVDFDNFVVREATP